MTGRSVSPVVTDSLKADRSRWFVTMTGRPLTYSRSGYTRSIEFGSCTVGKVGTSRWLMLPMYGFT